MAIRLFDQIGEKDHFLGGKAWGLGRLSQLGFPVPKGLVITKQPSANEWMEIFAWWRDLEFCPLAVRSSAGNEDSLDHSFAGQNQSFLNQRSEKDLKAAVSKCFESIHRTASESYREYFGENSAHSEMNVVLQRMVDPKFAGVFFSLDPRQGFESGWILEVITGLGENLVSGKVTPGQVREKGGAEALPPGFNEQMSAEIVKMGLSIRDHLGFEVDIEWAIDQKDELHLLQARPITTLKKPNGQDYLELEKTRLNQTYSADTTFDGQTFSEWAGLPSYFTFSVWREVFSPAHAFGDALRLLGYESFSKKDKREHSLLDRVMGRAYLNLSELSDLYYGPIPFSIIPKPRPHTVFDWKKLNLKTILHFPRALLCMLRVAWNVSTKRSAWLSLCQTELAQFSQKSSGPRDAEIYGKMQFHDLLLKLKEKSDFFSKSALMWPLVLVVLTESTLQRLRLILMSVFDEKKSDEMIREYMARGLHTVTLEMEKAYEQAYFHPVERPFFMARFGHRGPGEMDLKNPRWFELGEKAWLARPNQKVKLVNVDTVEADIRALATFKREVILDEWRLLKRMLELREQWKMEILKPYAEIRLILLELGKRKELGNAIHWLRLSEILKDLKENEKLSVETWNEISDRQEKARVFKSYGFPEVVSMAEINDILSGKMDGRDGAMSGEALSPGLVSGEVRVVGDPSLVDTDQWPERVILVAETTDPGWTPLFAKASAILVERGGVLSHCAIVAREMGIPAISGIPNATERFKDGETITIDGNHGKVFR